MNPRKHLPCKRRCPFPSMSAFTLKSTESVDGNAALSLVRAPEIVSEVIERTTVALLRCRRESEEHGDLTPSTSLKPLGQIRESFILAVNHDGLWIVDQHVAHERVLFERS
jgi:DNA mismatch repair ATPase MutL